MIIRPARPYLEWAAKVEAPKPGEIDELAKHVSVYLVGEDSDGEEETAPLEDYFEDIFEAELAAWCTHEKDWPKNRTLEMFLAWFEVTRESIVTDLEPGPIEHEDDTLRFVAISDTHMAWPELPEGDALIHAGDLTFRGTLPEVREATLWLHDQKTSKRYKHVIVIAGNHDWLFERESRLARQLIETRGLIYLEDSGLTLSGGEAILGKIDPGPGRITV